MATSIWKGVKGYEGQYAIQDSEEEQRIFACAATMRDHFASTTRLSAKYAPTALAQCNALMSDVVPYMKGLNSLFGKTIISAKFYL